MNKIKLNVVDQLSNSFIKNGPNNFSYRKLTLLNLLKMPIYLFIYFLEIKFT